MASDCHRQGVAVKPCSTGASVRGRPEPRASRTSSQPQPRRRVPSKGHLPAQPTSAPRWRCSLRGTNPTRTTSGRSSLESTREWDRTGNRPEAGTARAQTRQRSRLPHRRPRHAQRFSNRCSRRSKRRLREKWARPQTSGRGGSMARPMKQPFGTRFAASIWMGSSESTTRPAFLQGRPASGDKRTGLRRGG